MEKAHSNIMLAASASHLSPRCLMISSIGIGGSSWLVKFLLKKIGGKEGFTDFENAEKRVLEKRMSHLLLSVQRDSQIKKGKKNII